MGFTIVCEKSPPGSTLADLSQFFQKYGKLTGKSVYFGSGKNDKRIFVEYLSANSAVKAAKTLNGNSFDAFPLFKFRTELTRATQETLKQMKLKAQARKAQAEKEAQIAKAEDEDLDALFEEKPKSRPVGGTTPTSVVSKMELTDLLAAGSGNQSGTKEDIRNESEDLITKDAFQYHQYTEAAIKLETDKMETHKLETDKLGTDKMGTDKMETETTSLSLFDKTFENLPIFIERTLDNIPLDRMLSAISVPMIPTASQYNKSLI